MGRAAGTALLGLALALAAATFGAQALYVPGVGLLLLGAVAGGWVRLAARSARIVRAPIPARVVEGEPLELRIEVRAGAAGLPGGEVRDPALSRPLPLRPTGQARRGLRGTISFARRGMRELGAPELRLADPLALAERRVAGSGRAAVLVLPRIEPVVAAGGGGLSRAGLGRPGGAEEALEVDGLRPYREGTPASRIHWPALARGRGLVERRLRAESEDRPLVVLDARGPGGEAGDEALDAAVRAAASLARALAAAGGCDLLLPGERRAATLDTGLGGWAGAHARLALVARSARPPLLRGPLRRGALVYVAASRIERLPPEAAALARGPALLVVPGSLPGRAAALEVAGCRGYAAGGRRRSGARSREAVA